MILTESRKTMQKYLLPAFNKHKDDMRMGFEFEFAFDASEIDVHRNIEPEDYEYDYFSADDIEEIEDYLDIFIGDTFRKFTNKYGFDFVIDYTYGDSEPNELAIKYDSSVYSHNLPKYLQLELATPAMNWNQAYEFLNLMRDFVKEFEMYIDTNRETSMHFNLSFPGVDELNYPVGLAVFDDGKLFVDMRGNGNGEFEKTFKWAKSLQSHIIDRLPRKKIEGTSKEELIKYITNFVNMEMKDISSNRGVSMNVKDDNYIEFRLWGGDWSQIIRREPKRMLDNIKAQLGMFALMAYPTEGVLNYTYKKLINKLKPDSDYDKTKTFRYRFKKYMIKKGLDYEGFRRNMHSIIALSSIHMDELIKSQNSLFIPGNRLDDFYKRILFESLNSPNRYNKFDNLLKLTKQIFWSEFKNLLLAYEYNGYSLLELAWGVYIGESYTQSSGDAFLLDNPQAKKHITIYQIMIF